MTKRSSLRYLLRESPGRCDPDSKGLCEWTSEGVEEILRRKAYVSCRGYEGIPREHESNHEAGWHREFNYSSLTVSMYCQGFFYVIQVMPGTRHLNQAGGKADDFR